MSPLTPNLESEEEILSTTLEVVSPMPDTLSLEGEEEILATTLEVMPDTLNLKRGGDSGGCGDGGISQYQLLQPF
jgi:hypothetical protein